jgi:hypothetical protein
MEHILTFDQVGLRRLREIVFPAMANGQTILFLGAGASATDEKKYLSEQIVELYSATKGITLSTHTIIEFVDTMSANLDFDRSEFDDFIDALLKKLKVTDTHRIIASIPWKEIITTNSDLLVEKAFDDLIDSPEANLRLVPVRKVGQYKFNQANDQLKYVKLNGCISDKKSYPLVFSTQDFQDANVFYKTVLKSLEDLSNRISYLSVGYSYRDNFAKSLLQRFDRHNFRSRKWMWSVDPAVEDARLPFFTEQRICIIRSTSKQFFEEFKKWESDNHANLIVRRRIAFTSRANRKISLPDRVALRIGSDLLPISEFSSSTAITAESFYKGEQPNFDVVRKDYDVVKTELLKQIKPRVSELFSRSDSLVPILFLTGSYGTGKTTFCYRIIDELLHDPTFDGLAFEVMDAKKLTPTDLGELFIRCGAKNIILFFNGIEIDSAFKALIEFRAALSAEQFQNFRVLILASIRENILEKYKSTNQYSNTTEIRIDQPFVGYEAIELVDKLNSAGVLRFRDVRERNALAKKVVEEYSGDTLISLISLVSGSHHADFIRDAYSQLSPKAKEAFLYTSLLHRYSLLMPAGLLRSIMSKSWDEFTTEVLAYDSKGILIQETRNSVGTGPDIFLRTKHPILSDTLVKLYLGSEDKRFEKYRQCFQHLNPSKHSSDLVVDLLKALRQDNDLSKEKISKLFDLSSQIFDIDPHFNLHYAIDLQHRNDQESLEKAIERIKYAEAHLERRNHRLVHRRAVLNYILAKETLKRELEPNETYKYMNEAERLFEVKLILDPFSSFSYVDYIRFEMWTLTNLTLDEVETLRLRVFIEELLDKAEKSVFEGAHLITAVRAEYLRETKAATPQGRREYLAYLDELSRDNEKRPFALMLKYYYLTHLQRNQEAQALVSDLESYSYLDEVAKLLFRHYGRHLYDPNERIKFFDVIKNHADIQERDPVRYHYYSYVAEAYSQNFGYAYDHLGALRKKVHHLNPELNETWKDAETFQNRAFDGIVILSGKRKRIKAIDLQRSFDLQAGDYSNLRTDSKHKVHLHFYLNGIRAELVKTQHKIRG